MGASLGVLERKVKKHLGKSSSYPETQYPNAEGLLRWYASHRRTLPWRAARGKKPDPYRVWLSEIMLQQTTVATVGPYFEKFIKRWPTLPDLAAAELDDILRMWAGLGYYRRAKMLYTCAQKLSHEHGCVFPQDQKALLALPGFGPYTAAAVAAIAFGQKANVVDGNVERVMSRVFSIQTPLPKAKAELRAAAATLVPQKHCGDYAQALMDLGATVCTPRQPKCDQCPWRENCRAFGEGNQETLPRRARAKAKPVRRAVAFVLFNPKGEIFLRRRPPQGLLAHMMEVPSSPWCEGAMLPLAEALRFAPAKEKWELCPGLITHIFTHFKFEISVVTATTGKNIPGHWISPTKTENEALPSVMKKIVRHALAVL